MEGVEIVWPINDQYDTWSRSRGGVSGDRTSPILFSCEGIRCGGLGWRIYRLGVGGTMGNLGLEILSHFVIYIEKSPWIFIM